MENEDASGRPTLAFPLGLALLLLMLMSITTFFFCCIHWDKLRSFFGSSSLHQDHDPEAEPPQKPPRSQLMENQIEQQSLPVLMPGDQVPKFIAIACPCEPPMVEKKIMVVVDKPRHMCDASIVNS